MHTHRSMPLAFRLLVAATALLFVPLGAWAQETPRKIIVFQETVAGPAQDALVSVVGAAKIKSLPLVNAVVALAGPQAARALSRMPGVLRVEDDQLAYALGKPQPAPPPAESTPWGVDRIDADLAWGTVQGGNVKVAVLDTGIDLDHPDLKDRIAGGINTINPAKSPDDDNGHGTHVAGTIAASFNGIGVRGVAPAASLYAVKVLSRSGSGWLSDIIEGLQWCIDNHIQVANMSFGGSSTVDSYGEAIAAAADAGIVLVAAAGNSGPGDNTVGYPAKYEQVLAVSAVDSSDKIASFSSRGSEVDLAAPGVGIPSTYKGGGYKTLSGTSMASPHVAGAAALVAAALASSVETPQDLKVAVWSKLLSTADDLGIGGPDHLYGYGLVDAQEAATGQQTPP